MIGVIGVSAVIPCFNEAPRIDATIAALADVLDGIAPGSWEILVVDDTSTDTTSAVVAALAATDERIRLLPSAGGKGKGAAVRTGILAARGDRVLVTDADLAGDLDDAAAMLRRLDHGAIDAVVATRAHPGAVVQPPRSWGRRVPAAVFRFLARHVTQLDVSDPQCGLKAYRRASVTEPATALRTDGYAFEVELLLLLQRHAATIVEHPVHWSEGTSSKVRVVADGWRMFTDLVRIRRRGIGPAPSVAMVTSPTLVVVMPTRNESAVIADVVNDIQRHVLDVVDGSRLLVIDDESDAATATALEQLVSGPSITVVRNGARLGHGRSVRRGLDLVDAPWVLQLDSDGQCDPAAFAELWAAREWHDLVLGRRIDRSDGRHRRLVTAATAAVATCLAGRRIDDANAPMRLIHRDLYRHLQPLLPSRAFAPSTLITIGAMRSGAAVTTVDVAHRPRPAGRSTLRLGSLGRAVALSGAQALRFSLRRIPRFVPPRPAR